MNSPYTHETETVYLSDDSCSEETEHELDLIFTTDGLYASGTYLTEECLSAAEAEYFELNKKEFAYEENFKELTEQFGLWSNFRKFQSQYTKSDMPNNFALAMASGWLACSAFEKVTDLAIVKEYHAWNAIEQTKSLLQAITPVVQAPVKKKTSKI